MTMTPAAVARLQRRYGALTAADGAALDSAAGDLGIGIVQLMEAAGIQVARVAWRMLGSAPGRVHVVAGHGHNGGDGLVAARHLSSWGCAVSVSLVGGSAAPDALIGAQWAAATGAGVAVRVDNSADAGRDDGAALVIDALLGTGLRRPLRPLTATVVELMGGRILSVDVPSGLDATTGGAAGAAVRAACTVTLAACKQGFWTTLSRGFTGDLYVADIGMPQAAWTHCGLQRPTAVTGAALLRVPAPG